MTQLRRVINGIREVNAATNENIASVEARLPRFHHRRYGGSTPDLALSRRTNEKVVRLCSLIVLIKLADYFALISHYDTSNRNTAESSIR